MCSTGKQISHTDLKERCTDRLAINQNRILFRTCTQTALQSFYITKSVNRRLTEARDIEDTDVPADKMQYWLALMPCTRMEEYPQKTQDNLH